jgi:transcriptional regulator PpsR
MTALVSEPDFTLRLDARGTITTVSTGRDLAEESLSDWVGREWLELVGAEDRGKLEVFLSAARDGALCCEITQGFPSGARLPLEVTALGLGGDETLIVGRQQRVVAQLQSRLLDAQRTMERDYWRLREIETRWRRLFDDTTEALVSLDVKSGKIREANAVAAVLLGVGKGQAGTLPGKDLREWLAIESRVAVDRLVERLLEERAAPAVEVRLTSGATCLLRGSVDGRDDASLVLLRFLPSVQSVRFHSGVGVGEPGGNVDEAPPVAVDALLDRSPDGFVVTDSSGRILRANVAFADLAQVGSPQALIGTSLSELIGRPFADPQLLLSYLKRNGRVWLFDTCMAGDRETQIELSAVGDREQNPTRLGFIVRDVSRRLSSHSGTANASDSESVRNHLGHKPLKAILDETVAKVERSCVGSALAMTGYNRTAAAQLLGLSRQTLHGKMKRYGLSGGTRANMAEAEPGLEQGPEVSRDD